MICYIRLLHSSLKVLFPRIRQVNMQITASSPYSLLRNDYASTFYRSHGKRHLAQLAKAAKVESINHWSICRQVLLSNASKGMKEHALPFKISFARWLCSARLRFGNTPISLGLKEYAGISHKTTESGQFWYFRRRILATYITFADQEREETWAWRTDWISV